MVAYASSAGTQGSAPILPRRLRRRGAPARGSRAPGGASRLRVFAAQVGSEALLCVGIPVPAAGQRLRAVASDGSGVVLCRLRVPLPPPSDHLARAQFMPASIAGCNDIDPLPLCSLNVFSRVTSAPCVRPRKHGLREWVNCNDYRYRSRRRGSRADCGASVSRASSVPGGAVPADPIRRR